MARVVGKVVTATKIYFDSAYFVPTLASGHTQNTDTNLGALGTKNPPIDADKVIYRDSTASDALVTSTFAQLKIFLLQSIFHVGCIWEERTGTNPATTFGFGTWELYGVGRVTVCIDSGDTDFDTVDETNGAKTKAISAHADTAVANHSDHVHSFVASSTSALVKLVAADVKTGVSPLGTSAAPSAVMTHSVTQPSAHSDLNVVQPSIVVYRWTRTA